MKVLAKPRQPGLLRRLHNDESGQIVPLFIFSALTLVFVIVLVLNTGRQAEQRIVVQNAADAAAMTQASWIARSLNVLSVNNSAITQTYATAILATAWQKFKKLQPGNRYQLIAKRSMRMVRGLEQMNRAVVEGFPAFSAGLAAELAAKNGITDAPIFYAGFDHPRYYTGMRKRKETRFASTALPVVASIDNPPYLCMTGTKGTPSAPSPDLNWNFQQYGYPLNEGPYLEGRNRLAGRIPIVQFLKRKKFIGIADDLWYENCSQSGTTVYRLANQPPATGPLDSIRDDWSVMAFTRSRGSAAALPSKFPNPPGASYAFAQAEVYNAVNYDLFSQDWHAKLVPARLLSGSKRERALEAVQGVPEQSGFPRLHEFLAAVSREDMEQYIAH